MSKYARKGVSKICGHFRTRDTRVWRGDSVSVITYCSDCRIAVKKDGRPFEHEA